MRSIRLSLVLYFLLLLAVTLGAVSVLVYRTTETSLSEKQQAMTALLRKQHQGRLDEILLEEARKLADEVKVQAERSGHRFARLQPPLGLLSAGFAPEPRGSIAVWWMQVFPTFLKSPRFAGEGGEQPRRRPLPPWSPQAGLEHLRWLLVTLPGPRFRVKKSTFTLKEDQLIQFVQINSDPGGEWHSDSMDGRSFGFRAKDFAGPRLVNWKFDDTSLSATPVRRVSLKVTHFPIDWAPRGGRPPPPGSESRSSPGDFQFRVELAERSPPAIYVQCAYAKSRTDGVLGRMLGELDQTIAGLEEATQETLLALGQTLLLISGLAFTAAFVGVFLLVRLGLWPLHKLSDAVSKISAKDFRLPLDDRRLPSELHPIVQRLEQTLDLLKRTFEREKQAAADISHELRTPLAAMLTTLEIALRNARSAEQYRELLEEARSSGQQMYSLVERLLTLARLDAGADHLRPREVDVMALAEQCASLVKPLAEARGLSLRVHMDGPACVRADPDKLREVVTNLLHNAIEYNKPEGSIDVAVARENGDVRVEVRDTGIGIAPDARRQIFERFYRSDPSRAAEGLHAGLGLAIVKGYVDLMGGTIDVESTEGEGSTFRVHLPVQPAAPHG